MKRILFVIGLSFYGYTLQANEMPRIYALHINGINTTRQEAKINSLMLEKSSSTSGNSIVWDIVYNPTRSDNIPAGTVDYYWNLFNNIIDVLYQKLSEVNLATLTLDTYTQVYIISNWLNQQVYSKNSQDYTTLLEILRPSYGNLLINYGGQNAVEILANMHKVVPPQFTGVLKLIHDNSQDAADYSHNPNAVLLIPHSQGNLYANFLYKYLTEVEKFNQHHIAIFGIATPASYNLGDWPVTDSDNSPDSSQLLAALKPAYAYITSCDDQVIYTLKWQQILKSYSDLEYFLSANNFPAVLECNFPFPTTPATNQNLGHNLNSYYLADSGMKAQISKMLNYYVYQLNYHMLHDLIANMTADNPGFGNYPQLITLVAGFRRDSVQKLVDSNGNIICEKNSCSDRVMYLNTPLLDNFIEAESGSSSFPTRLIHYFALPSLLIRDGYDNHAIYYIVEDQNEINSDYWPGLIYPTQYSQAIKVNYSGSQAAPVKPSANQTCNYEFTGLSNEIMSDPYNGAWKLFYANNPLLPALTKCVDRFPELSVGKFTIDGKYQQQSF